MAVSSISATRLTTAEECIEYFFHQDMRQWEIFMQLHIRGHSMSFRHLQRKLKQLGLKRRNVPVDCDELIRALDEQMQHQGVCRGYRQMHHRLLVKHRIQVSYEVVRKAMKFLAPRAVKLRKRKRLIRRKFFQTAVNTSWHIDGYDKLKHYGISIIGAREGASRRILFLRAGTTNKNPRHVAFYYCEAAKAVGGIPRQVVMDAGTENVRVHDIQVALRYDDADSKAGYNSVKITRSTSNQRIESMWSYLQKNYGLQFWKDFCEALVENGAYNPSNPIELKIFQFCFIPVLQLQFDEITELWNTFPMRKNKNSKLPSGKPDLIFSIPEFFGLSDAKIPVCHGTLTDIQREFGKPYNKYGICDDDALPFLAALYEADLYFPQTINDALNCFDHLIKKFISE